MIAEVVLAALFGAGVAVLLGLYTFSWLVDRSARLISEYVRGLSKAPKAAPPPLPPRPWGVFKPMARFWDALDQWRAVQLSISQSIARDQERNALLIDGSREGLYDRDLVGGTTWMSARFHEILGLPDGALVGDRRRFASLIHPDDAPRHEAEYNRFSAERRPFWSNVFRMWHAEGRWIWIIFRAVLVYGPDGTPLRAVGSIGDVTAEREAERALRESEERSALVIDGSRDGIFDRDYRSRIVWFSERAHALFGLEDGALNGDRQGFLDLIHPDDRPVYESVTEGQLARQERYLTSTLRFRRADGTWRWIMIRARAVYDAQGAPIRAIGSFSDVTEQKEAEAALIQSNVTLEARVAERTAHLSQEIADRKLAVAELRHSQEILRGIMDAMPVGITLIDRDGVVTETNNHLRQIYPGADRWIGKRATELLSVEDAQIHRFNRARVGDEDQAGLVALRRQAILDPEQTPPEELIRTREGRFLEVTSARTPDGALIQVSHDRTELQEALRRQEIIFENISSGIVLWGPEGRVQDVNQRMGELVPWRGPRERAIGIGVTQMIMSGDWARVKVNGRTIPPEEIEDFKRNRIEQFRAGPIDTIVLMTAEGRSLKLECMRSSDNYIVMCGTDVSDIEDTLAVLARSDRMAALGGLVAGVAHEVNTPLGIAITASSLIENKLAALETAITQADGTILPAANKRMSSLKDTVSLVLRNLDRAADLVSSFKRVSVDQTSDQRRGFNFSELIQDIISTLHPQIRMTPHTIESICPKDLFVRDYPGALTQIITNFVMNSLIHAFPNDRVGHMQVEIVRNEGGLVFIYRDDGVGVPPDILDKIFEPFFTTNRAFGGSGLGLNIVYNLVYDKLDGRIEAKNEDGLAFYINLTSEIVSG